MTRHGKGMKHAGRVGQPTQKKTARKKKGYAQTLDKMSISGKPRGRKVRKTFPKPKQRRENESSRRSSQKTEAVSSEYNSVGEKSNKPDLTTKQKIVTPDQGEGVLEVERYSAQRRTNLKTTGGDGHH